MSGVVMPFAVKLSQIRKALGSRNKSLLLELREEFEEELEDDRERVEEANQDDDFDPELSLQDALRHLIMGEDLWDYEGEKYGHSLELMCAFFGEFLANEHWTGIPLDWADAADEALLELGVPAEVFSIFNHLLDRGAPVDIPEIDEVPWIGYVTLAEIRVALAELSEIRLTALKSNVPMQIALKQVRDWLDTCQRDKSDLVCFYY